MLSLGCCCSLPVLAGIVMPTAHANSSDRGNRITEAARNSVRLRLGECLLEAAGVGYGEAQVRQHCCGSALRPLPLTECCME